MGDELAAAVQAVTHTAGQAHELARECHRAIYGYNGTVGLLANVQALRDSLDRRDTRQRWMMRGMIGAFFSAVGALLLEWARQ